MRLFAEEKSGKQKTTKGNKNKGKNNDKKKDNSSDKEQKRAEREKHHEVSFTNFGSSLNLNTRHAF